MIEYLVYYFNEHAEKIERWTKRFFLLLLVLVVLKSGVWFYDNCIEWDTPATGMANATATPTQSPSIVATPLPTAPPLVKQTQYGAFYQYSGKWNYGSSTWINDETKRIYLDDVHAIPQVYDPGKVLNDNTHKYYLVFTRFGLSTQGEYDPARNVIYTITRDDIYGKYLKNEALYGGSD